jgi:hypothetical protein
MSLATLVPKTREETFMADDNDKILPVIRLLLAAFLGLLFVLVLQLFFLVSRAITQPRTVNIRAGYPQLNGG